MTSHRLAPGDLVPHRALTTVRAEPVRVPARAPGTLTHLQFRRFAGCPICTLHLRSVARRHDEIREAGVIEVAVFHSFARELLPHLDGVPFAAVADPGRELYAAFGVETSPRAMLSPRVWPAALRAARAVGPSQPPVGDTSLGLPADFLLDSGGRVRAARYGRHANDQWTVDELLRLARTPPPPPSG